MRIRYGGTNFVRTDVSAANCTSGRKCLYRLDEIVCDVSYMTAWGVDVILLSFVSFIPYRSYPYRSIVSRASLLLLSFVSFVSFIFFLPLIYYYHVVDSSLLGG